MNYNLKELLVDYGCKNPNNIKEMSVSECKLSILQVRDALLLLGEILYENVEEQVYVATIRAGYGNMNSAVVALKLCENTLWVVGYAKEGIIKQNICEQALQKIVDAAHGKVNIKVVKRNWLGLPIIILIILVPIIFVKRNVNTVDTEGLTDNVSIVSSTEDKHKQETVISPEEAALNAEIELVLNATAEYNEAVKAFNKHVAEYNKAVEITCIDNIKGFPKSIESLSLVSENRDDIALVVQSDNNKEKIVADTETILEMTEELKYAIEIVRQITAPTEEWVEDRLGAVKEITGMQAVSENLNPDGLLGKEGGYSACIYFTTEAAIPEDVPGNNIVEKGTDAGGAVEIYANLADAEARVEYLAGFDGTVLYSGSYAIIGTMVIRTSYKLSNEQQLLMTSLITTEMTKISEVE